MPVIPYWSGYNYQGKVMLLVILQHINQNPSDYSYFSVEPEKIEDFVMYKHDCAQNFYQVKAYPKETKWGGYTKAMTDLLTHRSSVVNRSPSSECVLCVTREIENWNTASNRFNNDITVYTYRSDYPSLNSVIDCIKTELSFFERIFLAGKNLNIEIAYFEICFFLDLIIREIHLGKRTNYKVSLEEFYNCIVEAQHKDSIRTESNIREAGYNYIIGSISQAIDSYCDKCSQDNRPSCQKLCGVPRYYSELLKIANISKLCQILNPGSDIRDDAFECVAHMNASSFEENVYPIFTQQHLDDVIKADSNVVGLATDKFDVPSKRLVPTLLEFKCPVSVQLSEKSVESQLETMSNNSDVLRCLNGCAITAYVDTEIENVLIDKALNTHSISYYSDNLLATKQGDNNDESKKIIPKRLNVKLISVRNAVQILEGAD